MANEADTTSKRNSIIAYILNNASNKLPMKVSDIHQLLGKQPNTNEAIDQAAIALKKDFGIVLDYVPEQKTGKKFICYTEDPVKSCSELDVVQKRETTLLFIILSYIFMSGGNVYEEKLEHFLNGLAIFYDEDHSYFGPDIKKLVTETFVKQLYLKKSKSESELDTEVKYLLNWGFRASKEFNKLQVLEAVSKLMGRNVRYFQVQFESALKETGNTVDDDEVMVVSD